MRTDVNRINENTPWQELTEGLKMFAGGTARNFATGEWRTNTVCPFEAIEMKEGIEP